MMIRGFFEAVDRVVRDIMKNESEPSGGKAIVFIETTDKFYLSSYLKYARMNRPRSRERWDLAKFSNFLLQIGEGRYPVNEDIGEGDICLPHDIYVFRIH
ncbi:Helitron helicase [Phytophthora megakarya]|uniref:Helitron helicase n=1 Tax=Phytophthora megakarya TaxID=4795 RepID=A0A225V137_9STRA|nr:Helitron helicase [Phytophthora megakarya]